MKVIIFRRAHDLVRGESDDVTFAEKLAHSNVAHVYYTCVFGVYRETRVRKRMRF